ncbi:MAG: PIN domain-containing protein [Bacteriovoracaceae bacterium]|nr:PIN domain-containing protein [Bacteriovoracaceae bacterium]
MIFIDTSVWIEYFRGNDQVTKKVDHLLDNLQVALAAPVYLEILNGAKKNELDLLEKVFSALPKYYPNDDSWQLIAKWITISKMKGHNFSIPDFLIAAIVVNNNSKIWSLDKDFKRMSKLGFINLMSDK